MLAFLSDVSLGESEVQKEDLVGCLVEPNTKVIRLYVSMEKVSSVNVLNSLNHLVYKH